MTAPAEVKDFATHDYHFFKVPRPQLEVVSKFVDQIHSNGWEPVQIILGGYQQPIILARRTREPQQRAVPSKPLLDAQGSPLILGVQYLYCAGCRGLITPPSAHQNATLCDGCRTYTKTCRRGPHCGRCGEGKTE